MEVDVFPLAIDPLPNAGFLRCDRDRLIVATQLLHKPDVSDHRGIAPQHPHVWRCHRRVARLPAGAHRHARLPVRREDLVRRLGLQEVLAGRVQLRAYQPDQGRVGPYPRRYGTSTR